MNAGVECRKVLRCHPFGPSCTPDNDAARYFEGRVVSTEYWRRAQRHCLASANEVAAFAWSALAQAIQMQRLPRRAIAVRIQVVAPPPWDRACLDYRVHCDLADQDLQAKITATIAAGLIPFNAQWFAEDPLTGSVTTVAAFAVYAGARP